MLKKNSTGLSPTAAAAAAMSGQAEYMARLVVLALKLDALEKRVNAFKTVLDNPDMPAAEAKKILASCASPKEPVARKEPAAPKKRTKAKYVYVPGHVRLVTKKPAKAAAKAKPAKRKKK